jgi:hypothetical protein
VDEAEKAHHMQPHKPMLSPMDAAVNKAMGINASPLGSNRPASPFNRSMGGQSNYYQKQSLPSECIIIADRQRVLLSYECVSGRDGGGDS